jgi:polyphosphate kinase 2 (PPK2 family)
VSPKQGRKKKGTPHEYEPDDVAAIHAYEREHATEVSHPKPRNLGKQFYEAELERLQTELVKLQESIKNHGRSRPSW